MTDRLTMPGESPTDEDLRHDAELTRQELAETVAALTARANVKARVQDATHRRAEQLRTLANRLPAPISTRLISATHHPAAALAALAAVAIALRVWLKR